MPRPLSTEDKRTVDYLLGNASAIWHDFVGPYCYDEQMAEEVNNLENEVLIIINKYDFKSIKEYEEYYKREMN